MRMSIVIDVNTNDDGMTDDDNITMLYSEDRFYIEQGPDNEKVTISVRDKKQARALLMGMQAMIAALGWK